MPYDEKLFAQLDEIITDALAQEFEYAQGVDTDEPASEDVVLRILAAIDAAGYALTKREQTECASSPS